MNSPTRSLLIGAGFMLATLLIAVTGYMLAGWTMLEAVYMFVVTVYSVGYDEVREIDSPGLMLFTIFVIVAGCTSLIFMIGAFIQFLTEGQIQRLAGSHRMTKEITKLKNHVIVCGYGRLGQALADQLDKGGQPFIVIDRNPERVAQAQSRQYLVLEGDATDEDVLAAAHIDTARVLATVLSADEANVFITLSARNLRPDLEIIARGEQPKTERKLIQAGANRAVLPARSGATLIAEMILHPAIGEPGPDDEAGLQPLNLQLETLGLTIETYRIGAGSRLVGLSPKEVDDAVGPDVVFVGVERVGGAVETGVVCATDPLAEGDRILYLGRPESISALLGGELFSD